MGAESAALTIPIVDTFIDALWLEEGLSANTLAAYRRDVQLFAQWLHDQTPATDLLGVDEPRLQLYQGYLFAQGHKASTANRRFTVLKRFYRWALRERHIAQDPTLRLIAARMPLRVPKLMSEAQVEDVIAVIHNTLRGVPIDLRELVLDERDNGDALRRRMQAGDISVDENLTRYHDEYRRSFRESDSGRRFEDAFQVIITDEGRQQIDEALRAIAKTPYLAGESGVLLGQIRDELARIYDGIEAVRRQMRVSDEAISRLVRQQTDTRYRTMLTRLNRLYARLNADAKTHMGDASRPYDTATSDALFAPLPMRPAKSMTRATAPGLSDLAAEAPQSTPVADLRDMVNSGGPRLLRMVSLIDVLDDGLSSVYTFYDPDVPGAGFGKYSILWQIAQCKANGLPYLYLGYWIRDCGKMAYKADYRPIEGLIDGTWQTLPTPASRTDDHSPTTE